MKECDCKKQQTKVTPFLQKEMQDKDPNLQEMTISGKKSSAEIHATTMPLTGKFEIMVCCSSGCERLNSKAVYEKFLEFADENLKICKTGCLGLCGVGPNVLVYPGEIFYNKVRPEDVEEIIGKTRAGEVVTRLLYRDKDGVVYQSFKDIPFFKAHTFISRANNGGFDYGNLKPGVMMDFEEMNALGEDACKVDLAKFFMTFAVDESCGECTPCRIGNKRMLEILTKITEGKAKESDLDELEKIANYTKDNSLCEFGRTSSNPVLSTLHHFRDEYLEHIHGRCPSGVCKGLVKYEIDKTKCIGCTACARVCPTNAISGSVRQPHEICQEKCIKCGACSKTCKFSAIRKV